MRVPEDREKAVRAAKAKEDREQRRIEAMKTGKEILWLNCPLCGKGRPLHSRKGDARFAVKLDYGVVMVRKGGGNRIGFFRVEGSEVTIQELEEAHPEVFENLKVEVAKLHEALSLT